MVKAPIAGTVKTRLRPFLSADETAKLAACFAQDAVNKAQSLTENVIISYTPREGRKILAKILPETLIWHEQYGADLGERMHYAVEFGFRQGFSPLIVIGTDSPNLPLHFFELAEKHIQTEENDIVLIPTEDGGFCLIALKKPDFELFGGVEWSSAQTFEQTVQNINQLKLRLKTLDLWYDVDFPEDLSRLNQDLWKNPAIAPHTAQWLKGFPKLNKT